MRYETMQVVSKTIVRCHDRMTFRVNPKTLEALSCSVYDAYCFSDPQKGVDYMEYFDWLNTKSTL